MSHDRERIVERGDTNWQTCPWCNSQMIEGGSIEIDGDWCIQDVACTNCSRMWWESYRAHHRILPMEEGELR